jgi:hypothetical protein
LTTINRKAGKNSKNFVLVKHTMWSEETYGAYIALVAALTEVKQFHPVLGNVIQQLIVTVATFSLLIPKVRVGMCPNVVLNIFVPLLSSAIMDKKMCWPGFDCAIT